MKSKDFLTDFREYKKEFIRKLSESSEWKNRKEIEVLDEEIPYEDEDQERKD